MSLARHSDDRRNAASTGCKTTGLAKSSSNNDADRDQTKMAREGPAPWHFLSNGVAALTRQASIVTQEGTSITFRAKLQKRLLKTESWCEQHFRHQPRAMLLLSGSSRQHLSTAADCARVRPGEARLRGREKRAGPAPASRRPDPACKTTPFPRDEGEGSSAQAFFAFSTCRPRYMPVLRSM